MKRLLLLSQLIVLTMTGCSLFSKKSTQVVLPPPIPHTQQPDQPIGEHDVVTTPYPTDDIKKEALPPPSTTTPVTTVVVPFKQPPARPIQTKDTAEQSHNQPPAVQNLMNQAQQAFKQQQIDRAEHLALQAQRIAPQNSDSYALLAQVALHKKNIGQAQALAQRAASLSSDINVKKQLWTLVLRTAQQQNNSALVSKAQSVLNSLP